MLNPSQFCDQINLYMKPQRLDDIVPAMGTYIFSRCITQLKLIKTCHERMMAAKQKLLMEISHGQQSLGDNLFSVATMNSIYGTNDTVALRPTASASDVGAPCVILVVMHWFKELVGIWKKCIV